MLGALLQIVMILVIVGILLWGLMQLPIAEPFKQLIKVLIIVICSIWFVYVLYGVIQSLPGTSPHLLR